MLEKTGDILSISNQEQLEDTILMYLRDQMAGNHIMVNDIVLLSTSKSYLNIRW
jgi:hypothetical protein